MAKISEYFVELFIKMFLSSNDYRTASKPDRVKEKYTLSSVFPSKGIMRTAEKYIE